MIEEDIAIAKRLNLIENFDWLMQEIEFWKHVNSYGDLAPISIWNFDEEEGKGKI